MMNAEKLNQEMLKKANETREQEEKDYRLLMKSLIAAQISLIDMIETMKKITQLLNDTGKILINKHKYDQYPIEDAGPAGAKEYDIPSYTPDKGCENCPLKDFKD